MPELAPDITAEELDKEVRDELRSLPTDLAELVGRHLVAAERALEEDDTDKAHEHTKAARRFAARIGVVREAAGIVAYRAGHFSEALSDLRAARRMTGSDAYLPIMADCERGLGRPERALDLVRSPEAERLDRAERIELSIVESGARRDLGQHDASVITLQRLPELRDPQPKPWSARLAFAYADALAEAGHQEAATDWFARAMAFDEDGETDAAERYAELTGAVIEDIEEDFDDESEGDGQDVEDSLGLAGDLLVERDESAPVHDDSAAGEPGAESRSGSDDAEDVVATPESSDLEGVAEESDEAQEAGDVLETPEAGDPKDIAAGTSGDLSEAPDASDSSEGSGDEDAARPADAEDVPEPSDAVDADEVPEPADVRSTPAEAELDDEEPGDDRTASAEAVKGDTPDINLAFIEPDFGDILDEPDEPAKDHPKRDD
ncbi:hypothetical protein [Nonomuraea sp. NPDC048916]|uniref:hypothetical protein n=1 Tax=Nonomuraea sp. NPDC048916 TaxID=3154232 RepID=UPI0033CC1D4E